MSLRYHSNAINVFLICIVLFQITESFKLRWNFQAPTINKDQDDSYRLYKRIESKKFVYYQILNNLLSDLSSRRSLFVANHLKRLRNRLSKSRTAVRSSVDLPTNPTSYYRRF
ncbi:hypothetical protein SNEBB_003161 [Seison nebaliae]|nr:hypothetical protein SNEBB_003161 [Seison nebaliae]